MNKMKTIVFASAAHEFRSPLNGIVNSLDLLRNQIEGEQALLYF